MKYLLMILLLSGCFYTESKKEKLSRAILELSTINSLINRAELTLSRAEEFSYLESNSELISFACLAIIKFDRSPVNYSSCREITHICAANNSVVDCFKRRVAFHKKPLKQKEEEVKSLAKEIADEVVLK